MDEKGNHCSSSFGVILRKIGKKIRRRPIGVFFCIFVVFKFLKAGAVNFFRIGGSERDKVAEGAVLFQHQTVCHIGKILFLHAQLPQGGGHADGMKGGMGYPIPPKIYSVKPVSA